jgi:N6-adenosine-specific RNA methylase IME4
MDISSTVTLIQMLLCLKSKLKIVYVLFWDAHVVETNWQVTLLDTRKPEELYHIIEHFCLGTRRLELFGEVS